MRENIAEECARGRVQVRELAKSRMKDGREGSVAVKKGVLPPRELCEGVEEACVLLREEVRVLEGEVEGLVGECEGLVDGLGRIEMFGGGEGLVRELEEVARKIERGR